MSFLDRSVPLKYAILGAIVIAVFTGMSVHELHSRSDSKGHYGPAIPAEVVKADDPKTVGGIFGLWGETYTDTHVKVMPPSGEPLYYSGVSLAGSVDVGDELKAWFYDGDPDSAYFSNWFEASSKETYATPWPSVEDQIGFAFAVTLLVAIVAFVILKALSIRKSKNKKRRQSASPRRNPEKPMAM
jgi:hypothetical protein